MFIRTLAALEAAGRIKLLVNGTTRSARFLTAADGMGFSYNENRVTKGSDATLWYKHHWEANYIVSGHGELHRPDDRPAMAARSRHALHRRPPTTGIVSGSPRTSTTSASSAPRSKATRPTTLTVATRPTVPTPAPTAACSSSAPTTCARPAIELIAANGQARTIRMLTQADNVGFGFCDVHLAAGAGATLWYKHHWEAKSTSSPAPAR